MTTLLHICPQADWRAAQATGAYRAASLETEGFIHCSLASQLLGVANVMFTGQTDLVLLVINSELLTESLFFEDCYETGQKFPHIYGPLNLEAVTDVVAFPAGPDGRFSLPPELPAAD